MAEASKPCSIEKCKRPYRAKGYCNIHYKKWRRGEYGHARYDTCSQQGCRKPVHLKGVCTEHFGALHAKKAPAEAAAPAPAA